MKFDDCDQSESDLRESWKLGECPRIYGPVQSRRHGLSLGINLGDVHEKICNWGCVYCQCGFARPQNKLRSAVAPYDVIKDLEGHLNRVGQIDSVTIAGNTEPSLYPYFEEVIEGIKIMRRRRGERWVFNALTNGSHLNDPKVRRGLLNLDEFWLKLDCGDSRLFKRVNHPQGPLSNIQDYLNQIAELETKNIQTLIWHDESDTNLGNDTKENLSALLCAYEFIQPTNIHLTTIDRSPAFKNLSPVSEGYLEEFANEVRAKGFSVSIFGPRRNND